MKQKVVEKQKKQCASDAHHQFWTEIPNSSENLREVCRLAVPKILLLENKSFWENAQKKQPVLFSELMQMYAAKYATEATVESFIRYKTSLESGVLSQSSRLKMGDNSRLYLGSKAAKLANTHVPIAVHFRNQMRWRASGSLKNCARKQPLVLEEFARKKKGRN